MKCATKDILPEGAIELITELDHAIVGELIHANEYVDVIVPRGGAGLIRTVVENSRIPVIETGTGNCHIYVDKDADLNMAADIIFNAKTSRPSVCNAAESLLIHKDVAEKALKLIACSAAASLSEVSASDGVKTKDEVLKLYELYGKK